MGNDYSACELALAIHLTPPLAHVSIVVPTFNRADKLDRLLAALTHQTFPLSNVEVVVADDGSTDGTREVVGRYADRFDLKHAWQPDRGHTLAAVCNLGMRTARHDRLVLLQSDMIPGARLIEAYMQWLNLPQPLLLIGGRVFVTTDELPAEALQRDPDFEASLTRIRTNNKMWANAPKRQSEDWREQLYRETDRLKTEKWPFRAVVGSNLAFHRRLIEDIGGFDEDFQSWGGEDGEFGYRAFNAGCFFVPVRQAIAYHQEPPGGENETDRLAGFERSKALQARKCALPPFGVSHRKMTGVDRSALIATLLLLNAATDIREDDAGSPQSLSSTEINAFIGQQSTPYLLLAARPLDIGTVDAILDAFAAEGAAICVRHLGALGETPAFLAFSRRTWAQLGGFKLQSGSLQGLSSELERVCRPRDHTRSG